MALTQSGRRVFHIWGLDTAAGAGDTRHSHHFDMALSWRRKCSCAGCTDGGENNNNNKQTSISFIISEEKAGENNNEKKFILSCKECTFFCSNRCIRDFPSSFCTHQFNRVSSKKGVEKGALVKRILLRIRGFFFCGEEEKMENRKRKKNGKPQTDADFGRVPILPLGPGSKERFDHCKRSLSCARGDTTKG